MTDEAMRVLEQSIKRAFSQPFLPEGHVQVAARGDNRIWVKIGRRDATFDLTTGESTDSGADVTQSAEGHPAVRLHPDAGTDNDADPRTRVEIEALVAARDMGNAFELVNRAAIHVAELRRTLDGLNAPLGDLPEWQQRAHELLEHVGLRSGLVPPVAPERMENASPPEPETFHHSLCRWNVGHPDCDCSPGIAAGPLSAS